VASDVGSSTPWVNTLLFDSNQRKDGTSVSLLSVAHGYTITTWLSGTHLMASASGPARRRR